MQNLAGEILDELMDGVVLQRSKFQAATTRCRPSRVPSGSRTVTSSTTFALPVPTPSCDRRPPSLLPPVLVVTKLAESRQAWRERETVVGHTGAERSAAGAEQACESQKTEFTPCS